MARYNLETPIILLQHGQNLTHIQPRDKLTHPARNHQSGHRAKRRDRRPIYQRIERLEHRFTLTLRQVRRILHKLSNEPLPPPSSHAGRFG